MLETCLKEILYLIAVLIPEQQLSIFKPVPVYRPKIVIKVVKPTRAYPIIYANVIPIKLKPNVYNPIFSPISAAIMQRISIQEQQAIDFL